MPGSFSSNVILAKALAMYGHCLKPQNYKELLACHSVSEIAAYLKTRTSYATALREINEATIHRGYLEMLLRRKLFGDYASLSRYDMTVGSHLSDYLLERGEIDQIVQGLRLLGAGRPEEFFFSMPPFFSSHTRLNLIGMSKVKTYGQLLEELAGTPYRAILARFTPKTDESGSLHIPITDIETALYRHLIETLQAVIARTHGKERQQLTDLCGAMVDAQNVTRILRLKQFFHASPDAIRAQLLPSGGTLSRRMQEAMIDADSPDEVVRLFYTTAAGRKIPEDQRRFIHDLDDRASYFTARHHIHFSSSPMVVMFSYVILTDIEVDDIINIIEGVRYGMTAEQIRPMLVML